MKKISTFLFSAAALILCAACAGEEENLFDRSAAERLQDSKQIYTERFAAAKGGWAMEYYPTNTDGGPTGQGYLMLVRFRSDHSVTIAMNNDMSDNAYMEDTSVWEMIADQGPVLTFNTLNECLHLFSNPSLYDTGLGYEGDYEFQVLDLPANGDYAMLKGKKRGTYIRLTQLPEGTDFEEYLNDVKKFQNTLFPADAPNSNLLMLGQEHPYVFAGVPTGYASIYPQGGDAISETTDHAFLITRHNDQYSLRFRDVLERDSLDDTVQELIYDPQADEFRDAAGGNATLVGYPAPAFFTEYQEQGRNYRWNVTTTSAVSDKFKAYIDALTAGFSTMKARTGRAYAFVGLAFGIDPEQGAQVAVRYTPGTNSTAEAGYKYELNPTDEGFLLAYNEPATAAAGNVSSALTAVADVLSVLSQEFVVSPAGSKFNLSTLRLTAKADPDLWFVVNK